MSGIDDERQHDTHEQQLHERPDRGPDDVALESEPLGSGDSDGHDYKDQRGGQTEGRYVCSAHDGRSARNSAIRGSGAAGMSIAGPS